MGTISLYTHAHVLAGDPYCYSYKVWYRGVSAVEAIAVYIMRGCRPRGRGRFLTTSTDYITEVRRANIEFGKTTALSPGCDTRV